MRALAFILALSALAAFEYGLIVWLSGPYECINCDPE